MGGLILLAGVVGWTVVCVMLLRRIGRHIQSNSVRWVFYVGMSPALFALPLADELIGAYQFEQYCKQAEDVTILGAIPVGEELYYSNGRWRRSNNDISLEEARRIDELVKQLLVDESRGPEIVPGVVPILAYETRILERQSGHPLASYKYFAARGGWLSGNLEKPLVMRDQFFPGNTNKLLEQIFLFDSAKGK